MIIILEGPDGIGKTTIAKQLKYNYFNGNAKIIKFSNKSDISLNAYINAINNSYDNLIFDRFNLSEDVYSTVYKRKPKNSLLDHLKILSLIEKYNGIYFILYSSNFNKLYKQCISRGDTKQVYENLEKINSYYYSLADALKKIYPNNVFLIDIVKERINNEQD